MKKTVKTNSACRRIRWHVVAWAICWLSCWFGGLPSWAAETGQMVQKNGEWIFVDDLDPATKLLLERAVKQGTITKAE